MGQGNALIKANFHIDPTKLQLTDWVQLQAEAIWLEKFRLKNMATMLQQLFGQNEE